MEEDASELPFGWLAADFRDGAGAIDCAEEPFLPRVDRQIEIGESVIAIDQHGRRPRWQPVAHRQRIGQPNGRVVEPGVAVEINLGGRRRPIVPVRRGGVADHRSAEQFDGGILRVLWQRG